MVSLLYAALEDINNFSWRLSFYFFIILFKQIKWILPALSLRAFPFKYFLICTKENWDQSHYI